MRYVGNTSLSEKIQERILTTFQQTLSLAQEGNQQEALLGCDFILRLDPLFEPARLLQGRLNDSEGPVDVGEFAEFASVDLSLEVASAGGNGGDSSIVLEPPADFPQPPPISPGGDDLPAQLAWLLESRDFAKLMALAQKHRDLIAVDPGLQQLVDTATARLEAEPYVQSFLDSSRRAREEGDLGSAHVHLQKARELDPSHPGLRSAEAELAAATKSAKAATAGQPQSEGPSVDWVGELTLEVSDGQPSASLDSESEQRIDELLADGQQAFESGEYQSAIDAWSRIFLIDIDHAEAIRRIELARKLKAEVERQIEEAFHEAVSLFDSAKKDEARKAFDRVLELQPGHLGAIEYLDRLDSGDVPAMGAASPDLAPIVDMPSATTEEAAEPLDDLDLAPDFPQVGAADAVQPLPVAPGGAVAIPRRKMFALIGGGVLVLVLLVAGFLWSNRGKMFPNSAVGQQPSPVQQEADPIEKARELHEEGSTAMAISRLKRLPPTHPQYAEAQSLINLWEVGDQGETIVSEGPSAEQLERRDILLDEARRAAAGKENLRALDLFDRAARIAGLEEEDLQRRVIAEERLTDLEDELDLVQQGDWEYALPNLWRLHETDPDNKDVVRLMVDSYHNLGLRDLQRGDPGAAAEKFEEALDLSPNDPSIERLAEFATVYSERPPDLLYRIFVKYLPFR